LKKNTLFFKIEGIYIRTMFYYKNKKVPFVPLEEGGKPFFYRRTKGKIYIPSYPLSRKKDVLKK